MTDFNGKNTSGSDDIFDSLDLTEDTSLTKAPRRERGSAAPVKKKRELNSASETVDVNALKKEKVTKKKSRVKKIIFWTVLEVITLAAILVYGYFLRSWNLITRPEVNEKAVENHNLSAEKIAEMERGYWTFAVFGVDGRSASDLVSKGLNSDVVLIVSINQDTGEIRMCSVFRDTYLNISDSNRYRKINQAYAEGGPEQALAAINKNLDLNIKNYVTFNWKAVADGINILGGIDGIDISKAELYYINAFITETVNVTKIGSYQLKSTGVQHLDGVQAVAYGRLRLMDNDYARTERQKKVIKAAFEKAKQSNFSVLNNIMVVCFPEVATNINFNTVVAMAQDITKYNITESGGFPWQRSETSGGSLGDVVVPATLESNVRYLHEFLFDDTDYEPSQAVLSYSGYIKEKTGIYKEGQVVESVRTDGGLISSPKTTEASTESASGGEKSSESETGENEDIPELETDEEGNLINPTDENGETIYPTDEEGRPVIPDERPTDLEPGGEGSPGELSHGDDGENDTPGGVTGPGGTTGPGGGTAPETTRAQESSGRTEKPTPGGNEGNNGPGSENNGTNPTAAGNAGQDAPGGNGSEGGQSPVPGNQGTGNLVPGGTGGPGGSTDGPGGGSGSGQSEGPGGSSQNAGGSTDGPGSSSGSGQNAGPGGNTGSQNVTPGGPGSSSQTPGGGTGGPGGSSGGQTPGDAPIG